MRLRKDLARLGKVAVAFSGGVDSSLLLWVAVDELGAEHVVAVHAHTCLHKKAETSLAERFAEACCCRFMKLEIDPLAWPEFAANPLDRCYLCKKKLYDIFLDTFGGEEFSLVDGTNLDDLSSDRPGLKAVRECAVRTPLADARLTKTDVRELSRRFGLVTWNRPSASCLATRIPAGTFIEKGLLSRIDQAEEFLEGLGFLGCRVRSSGITAAIEVPSSQIINLANEKRRTMVVNHLKSIGFDKVVLNLEGRPEQ